MSGQSLLSTVRRREELSMARYCDSHLWYSWRCSSWNTRLEHNRWRHQPSLDMSPASRCFAGSCIEDTHQRLLDSPPRFHRHSQRLSQSKSPLASERFGFRYTVRCHMQEYHIGLHHHSGLHQIGLQHIGGFPTGNRRTNCLRGSWWASAMRSDDRNQAKRLAVP